MPILYHKNFIRHSRRKKTNFEHVFRLTGESKTRGTISTFHTDFPTVFILYLQKYRYKYTCVYTHTFRVLYYSNFVFRDKITNANLAT